MGVLVMRAYCFGVYIAAPLFLKLIPGFQDSFQRVWTILLHTFGVKVVAHLMGITLVYKGVYTVGASIITAILDHAGYLQQGSSGLYLVARRAYLRVVG